eukprot:CAMPEP_0194063832 /NCGR_PEP_ID=MMETSP0009_2-20130614/81355_1 /TAXON_ID=210454 /ORGANISM="Grammatophora oceanica, Strain CCMP 410" /LENGTH=366 /DNA_ID=CAMNT_0038716099 /DNA_START=260 /DNA_END=1357 /DNA_ORIENTATION=-
MNEDGPLVTQAYVCKAKGEPFALQDITLPPMKATTVQLDIVYCGLCHTDIHMRDNDWGISNYPMVAGHEGVGKIRKIGSSVANIKVGDMVGITWIRDSCRCCDPCLAGRENICVEGYQGTFLSSAAGPWGKDPYNAHGGCFSKIMRIEERFAIKIPEGIPPEVACPLICGGGTVFESVCDYVESGTRVGVASIGGLGTAAIKFCKSFGAHVTALSRSDAKKEKCLAIGADEYYACLGNAEKMLALGGKFDVIIDTSPANADVAPYMSMLKFNGTYCRVGIPTAKDMDFTYQYIPLIFTQKKIAGSIVTGTRRMKRMMELTLNEVNKFKNDPEEWNAKIVKFDKINEIMDELQEGKNTTNYRYIFEW